MGRKKIIEKKSWKINIPFLGIMFFFTLNIVLYIACAEQFAFSNWDAGERFNTASINNTLVIAADIISENESEEIKPRTGSYMSPTIDILQKAILHNIKLDLLESNNTLITVYISFSNDTIIWTKEIDLLDFKQTESRYLRVIIDLVEYNLTRIKINSILVNYTPISTVTPTISISPSPEATVSVEPSIIPSSTVIITPTNIIMSPTPLISPTITQTISPLPSPSLSRPSPITSITYIPEPTNNIRPTPDHIQTVIPTQVNTPTNITSIAPTITEKPRLTSQPITMELIDNVIPSKNNKSINEINLESSPKPTAHILEENCVCESDNNLCTVDYCFNNKCIHKPTVCGTPCSDDGKSVCNHQGQCELRRSENMPCYCPGMCFEGLSCSNENICKKTICGDEKCEGFECKTCAKDCSKEICLGNQVCDLDFGENCNDAPGDCLCSAGQICNPESPDANQYGCYLVNCGDGFCDSPFESKSNCCKDCGCPDSYYCDNTIKSCKSYCGNGICDYYECISCPGDCNCDSCKCDVSINLEESLEGVAGKTEKILLDIINTGEMGDSFSIDIVRAGIRQKGSKNIWVDAESSSQLFIPIKIPSNTILMTISVTGRNSGKTTSKEITVSPIKESFMSRFRIFADLKDIGEILFLILSVLFAIVFTRKSQENNDAEYDESENTGQQHQSAAHYVAYDPWIKQRQQWYTNQNFQQRKY